MPPYEVFKQNIIIYNLHYINVPISVRSHFCAICAKGFKRKRSLEVHMKSHALEKPFQCATCLKFFKNKQCLKKHHIRKHSGICIYYLN